MKSFFFEDLFESIDKLHPYYPISSNIRKIFEVDALPLDNHRESLNEGGNTVSFLKKYAIFDDFLEKEFEPEGGGVVRVRKVPEVAHEVGGVDHYGVVVVRQLYHGQRGSL